MGKRAVGRLIGTFALGLACLLSGAWQPGTAQAATSVPPVVQRGSGVVSTDPLPTAQINGVVYTQVVAGSTVFAAGSFTRARPAGAAPGAREVARSNLMAYDVDSGVMTSFAPVVNGTVRVLALSSDARILFVGGEFTRVGTATRNRFAAFDTRTGALLKLAPSFNNIVTTMTVDGSVLYAGGWFTTVNGNLRRRLAALTTTSGALTTWAPTADRAPRAMVMTPDGKTLVVGGEFTNLSGKPAVGMGALDAKTGAVKTWKINTVIKDGGPKTAILSLRADRDTIYGSGFAYGGGNFEGTFAASPKDGAVKWIQDCHGDVYDVAPVGDTLYSVGHAHYCANIGGFPDSKTASAYHRALAVTTAVGGTVSTNGQRGGHYTDFAGQPAPSLINWFPDLTPGTFTGLTQAAWSVAATSSYLLLGGEFTAVDGVSQQGLVRLALPSVAAPRQGPAAPTAPTATLASASSVAIRWSSSSDPDDLVLAYEVLRDGVMVGSATDKSPFWASTAMTTTDGDLAPATTYSYQVRVTDGDGNATTSPPVSVTTPASPTTTTRDDATPPTGPDPAKPANP